MNLSKILLEDSFSSAEMYEIAFSIHAPALQKYLKHLQKVQIKAIGNGLPKDGESAESYVRRQAVVVGGLEALETLLQIEKPNSQASS